jgi:hypothetical protein
MPSDPQVLGEQFFSYLRDLCVLGRRSPCSIDYFLCMPGDVCFVVKFFLLLVFFAPFRGYFLPPFLTQFIETGFLQIVRSHNHSKLNAGVKG